MAINQTNKLVWIVETIHKAGKISFEELNKKWVNDIYISNGYDMLKRTFHKWVDAINETFGLFIVCEKCGDYRYYIENDDDLKDGSVKKWLLSTYSVCNSISENKAIKNRIILENVPSGLDYLDPIIDAMKKNCMIHITYYRYWKDDTREHFLMPLCVKLFRQRWYMVGRLWPQGDDLLFCLDRIKDFRLSSHTFVFPQDFNPDTYFQNCFGIIVDEKIEPEDVKFKVSVGQTNYLRDLPMHGSQVELETNDEYSVFKVHVRPSYDFQQELLWNRETIEVLEPEWLRNEMASIIDRMSNKYKN